MGALEVVIPTMRHLFPMLFLPVWMTGWFFGETSAIHELTMGNANKNTEFLSVWLIAWTIGGVAACFAWLWNLTGKEILTWDAASSSIAGRSACSGGAGHTISPTSKT
jgi:hypothetical protein